MARRTKRQIAAWARHRPAYGSLSKSGSGDRLRVQIGVTAKLPAGMAPTRELLNEAIAYRLEHGEDHPLFKTRIIRRQNPMLLERTRRGLALHEILESGARLELVIFSETNMNLAKMTRSELHNRILQAENTMLSRQAPAAHRAVAKRQRVQMFRELQARDLEWFQRFLKEHGLL